MGSTRTSWEKVYREGSEIVVEKMDDNLTMSFEKARDMAQNMKDTDPRRMMLIRALPSTDAYKVTR